jgi:predicted DNA-binding transcriptional regulator AlpA
MILYKIEGKQRGLRLMEKDQYPLILKVGDIQEILGIGKAAAYSLMDQKGFPCTKIGRLKRVPRDQFFEWIAKTGLDNNV